ncbi:unnamed protein product [Rotaria socialis]|uniref:protein-tyrosine-phosphatase n=1 Tax=Rotaria socialis TaxID=392032 RepID=A0A819C655_9BILA|nr:unnamed protein product [Rotaria socialis]
MINNDFLYHGNISNARNIEVLHELDIQHILNVSQFSSSKDILGCFNELSINVNDTPETDIIHGQAGISRSSAIVLAYLLKYQQKTLLAAYGYLTERRHLAEPNDCFLLQLIRYEKELHNLT